MSLEGELRSWLLQSMREALIISPRFTDYKISQIPFADFSPVSFALDQKVEDMVSARIQSQQGGGDMEGQDMGLGGGLGMSPSKIGSMIKNPMGMAQARLFAAGAAPVLIAMMIKPVTEAIIAELTRPGGLLDTRFKRDIPNEIAFYLSREQQQRSRIGDRQVIIQTAPGFSNRGGFGHDSILRRISENRGDAYRTSGIGLTDKAYGVIP